MSIHYLADHLSREEKAVIFMSINFYMSKKFPADQSDFLCSISTELFKKHPSIDFRFYPLLHEVIHNFQRNLKYEGENYSFQAKDYFVYIDLLNRTENLLNKLDHIQAAGNNICAE